VLTALIVKRSLAAAGSGRNPSRPLLYQGEERRTSTEAAGRLCLGFTAPAMYAYIFFVYLFSTVVHSNLGVNFGAVQDWFVTPRYHHWHHGVEREAIDVNFAVHFPILDRLFGTYHLPADGSWPAGYGVHSEPVPKGYVKQFFYPFTRGK
jgi:sterol desaturase/sphingolipid hydroxylase (fatty acid hydroxylase superfamily)